MKVVFVEIFIVNVHVMEYFLFFPTKQYWFGEIFLKTKHKKYRLHRIRQVWKVNSVSWGQFN